MHTLTYPSLPFAAPPKQPTIVIQGVQGAFHEIAARQYFGNDIQLLPAHSFDALIEALSRPEACDAAIMAIENSIAGAILGNYTLVKDLECCITGELYLKITQNLLSLPGATLDNIHEVHSHPMALAQCKAFLDQYPHIQRIESADTAASAALIAQHQLQHRAAIGSSLAADIYGLQILAPAIETNPMNYTRFWILHRGNAKWHARANKASVCFTTAHQPGSLSRILNMLSAEGANLTKIQSAPIQGRAWEYLFFVDFTLNNPENMPAALQLLDAMSLNLKVMGLYPSADHLFNETL